VDESSDQRSDKAQEQLIRAEGLEKLGSNEAARIEYEAIVSKYPETLQAGKAKEYLKELEKK